VIAVLGAPERRRRLVPQRRREAQPEPEPSPVCTGRATVIDLGGLSDLGDAKGWLEGAGEGELTAGLAVLNRALQSFRVVTADPAIREVTRSQLLVARIGYGTGEDVAEGRWSQAVELIVPPQRQGRSKVLQPQARLAALLAGREQVLVCEELALRARDDLEHGREREAALGLMVGLDAALAELPRDPALVKLPARLQELRAQRDLVAAAAQAALAGPLDEATIETVAFTLSRIEGALRARAVVSA